MRIIRYAVITAAIAAASAQAAHAQTREPRVTLSGLVQQEIVRIDGGEGVFTALGGRIDLRVARVFSIYGELTAGSGEANDAYEGDFGSASLQRARTWKAGYGSAFGVSIHTPPSRQVGVIVSAGLAGRQIELTDEFRNPAQLSDVTRTVSSRQRGGAQIGVALPIRLGAHLAIAPDLRWQTTFADEDLTVGTIGMRASWGF